MIIVQIHSVSLDICYDFELDERSRIETITYEVMQMFMQKSQTECVDSGKIPVLYSKEKEKILCGENSLTDYDIKTGDKLYLV